MCVCECECVCVRESLLQPVEHALHLIPRQSVGKGCRNIIFPWALWLSKVMSVSKDAFEEMRPLHHSGVVWGVGCRV